jgi:hypothetical protein
MSKTTSLYLQVFKCNKQSYEVSFIKWFCCFCLFIFFPFILGILAGTSHTSTQWTSNVVHPCTISFLQRTQVIKEKPSRKIETKQLKMCRYNKRRKILVLVSKESNLICIGLKECRYKYKHIYLGLIDSKHIYFKESINQKLFCNVIKGMKRQIGF